MVRRIIEGAWEDVVGRDELRGHRVRVIVIGESTPDSAATGAWLERLRAWSDGHSPVGQFVDDARGSVYGGTVDDPH